MKQVMKYLVRLGEGGFVLVGRFLLLLICLTSASVQGQTPAPAWSLEWLQGFEFKSEYLSLQHDCEQGFAAEIDSKQQPEGIVLNVQHLSWSWLCHLASEAEEGDKTVTDSATGLSGENLNSDEHTLMEEPSLLAQLRELAITPAQQASLKHLILQLRLLPKGDYQLQRLDVHTAQGVLRAKVHIQITATGIQAKITQQHNHLQLNLNWQQQELHLKTSAQASLIKPWVVDWPKGLSGTFSVDYKAPLDALWQGRFDISAKQVKYAPWLKQGKIKATGSIDAKLLTLTLANVNLDGQVSFGNEGSTHLRVSNRQPWLLTTSQIKGKLDLALTKARWQSHLMPELDVSLSVLSDWDKWQGKWQLASLRQVIEGSYDWQNAITVKLKPGYLYLPDMLAAAPKNKALAKTTLNQGKLHYQGQLSYSPSQGSGRISGQLNLKQLSGLVNDFGIQNGQLSMVHQYKIEQNKLKTLKEKNQLAIDELDIGVPISAIQSDLQLRQGDIKVDRLNAFLLGGSVSLANFEPFKLGMTKVSFAGIQLAALMDYGQLPGAQAAGLLDASIPLLNEADGFHIYDGEISARAPGGQITIPPSDAVHSITSTNKGVEFVFKVLENLSYSQLNGKLNYKPNGETDIKVSLVGRSPQISTTRPIEFNYSHQENLLQLLRSLRFANELERSLEEKYK